MSKLLNASKEALLWLEFGLISRAEALLSEKRTPLSSVIANLKDAIKEESKQKK